jgi:hypothetical protein
VPGRPEFPGAQAWVPDRPTPKSVARALQECRGCDLWERANQAVPGMGAVGADLVLLGEQPGDQEDHAGKPFVGPAGRLLDQASPMPMSSQRERSAPTRCTTSGGREREASRGSTSRRARGRLRLVGRGWWPSSISCDRSDWSCWEPRPARPCTAGISVWARLAGPGRSFPTSCRVAEPRGTGRHGCYRPFTRRPCSAREIVTSTTPPSSKT